MKTINDSRKETVSDSQRLKQIVGSLLKLAKEQDEWSRKFQAVDIEINEPISGNYLLVHLALDAMGVPSENIPKIIMGEGGSEYSVPWDNNVHFCRDYVIDQFDELVLQKNDIDGFIEKFWDFDPSDPRWDD